jgi:nicotinamidase-related amidase
MTNPEPSYPPRSPRYVTLPRFRLGIEEMKERKTSRRTGSTESSSLVFTSKTQRGSAMKLFRREILLKSTLIDWSLAAVICLLCTPAFSETIIDEWNTVQVPPAPELKPVKIDSKVTALLMLDFDKQICNAEKRPRCFASIPKVQKLLTEARARGVSVIHSIRPGEAAAGIAPELAPVIGEPVVSGGPDKFVGTNLEKILKEKGIKTVIVVGTTSQGAVLYTASVAALRGMKVIVPVDGMSADKTYAEQYVAWHLLNAPRISALVTLTRTDLIGY